MAEKIQKIVNRTGHNRYCENNILGKKLTFRYANDKQVAELGYKQYIITVNYIPVPVATIFLHT
jgi:hypothetical protein